MERNWIWKNPRHWLGDFGQIISNLSGFHFLQLWNWDNYSYFEAIIRTTYMCKKYISWLLGAPEPLSLHFNAQSVIDTTNWNPHIELCFCFMLIIKIWEIWVYLVRNWICHSQRCSNIIIPNFCPYGYMYLKFWDAVWEFAPKWIEWNQDGHPHWIPHGCLCNTRDGIYILLKKILE